MKRWFIACSRLEQTVLGDAEIGPEGGNVENGYEFSSLDRSPASWPRFVRGFPCARCCDPVAMGGRDSEGAVENDE